MIVTNSRVVSVVCSLACLIDSACSSGELMTIIYVIILYYVWMIYYIDNSLGHVQSAQLWRK